MFVSLCCCLCTSTRRSFRPQAYLLFRPHPVYYLSFPVVVVGIEDRPPLGDLGRALRHRPTLVLRGHPGVPPWLPHEGLANGEGGLGRKLVPPGAVLRQVCPFGEHRREIEVVQVALKRPAVGHLLAAGDAGLSDPGEHEALGEAVLVHPRHVPSPEQCATRGVVLEREAHYYAARALSHGLLGAALLFTI